MLPFPVLYYVYGCHFGARSNNQKQFTLNDFSVAVGKYFEGLYEKKINFQFVPCFFKVLYCFCVLMKKFAVIIV